MAEITQQSSEGKVRSRKLSTRIDMTPMVDLAFLLLTFFILTTKLLQPHVMKLDVPEDDPLTKAPEVNIERVLTLILGSNNKIYWFTADNAPQTTDFSAKGVRKVLFENNGRIKNMVILIKPSKESVYQNVIDILDEMTITEMKHYFLINTSNEDDALVRKLLAEHKTSN
jgi:biopolymer transport protein ExbD